MQRLDHKRKKFAWVLLLVYLPMLLAATFHFHSEAEADEVSYCYDCAHHLHHDGHLDAGQTSGHDCVLCQFLTLPYVVSTIIRIAAFVTMLRIVRCVSCTFFKNRKGQTLSTRAPPAWASL